MERFECHGLGICYYAYGLDSRYPFFASYETMRWTLAALEGHRACMHCTPSIVYTLANVLLSVAVCWFGIVGWRRSTKISGIYAVTDSVYHGLLIHSLRG